MAMVEKETEILTTKLQINSQVYWISEKRESLSNKRQGEKIPENFYTYLL